MQLPIVQNLVEHWIEYAAGGSFIAAHAYARFNTPPKNIPANSWPSPAVATRFSTTPRQYWTSFVLYLSALLVGYFFFSYSPALFGLTKLTDASDAIRNLSPPLLIALFLTILLPTVPFLSSADEALRQFFWEQASIPREILALRDRISKSAFTIPHEVEEGVRADLQESNFPAKWIETDMTLGSTVPWIKVAAVRLVVINYIQTYLPRFYGALSPELASLDARIKEFYATVFDYKNIASGHAALPSDPVVHSSPTPALHTLGSLRQQADSLLNILYTLLAYSINSLEYPETRKASLSRLGFSTDVSLGRRKSDILVFTFVCVAIMFFCCLMIVGPSSRNATQPNYLPLRLLDACRISALYSGAIACAILFRRTVAPGSLDNQAEWNLSYYTWAGIFAVAAGILTTLVFLRMELDTWGAASWRMGQTWPYLGVPLLIGFVTSLLIDRPAHVSSRLTDAVIMLIVSCVAGLLIHEMLVQIVHQPYPGDSVYKPGELEPRRVPPLPALLSIVGIVGMFVGAVIPAWYRNGDTHVLPAFLREDSVEPEEDEDQDQPIFGS